MSKKKSYLNKVQIRLTEYQKKVLTLKGKNLGYERHLNANVLKDILRKVITGQLILKDTQQEYFSKEEKKELTMPETRKE